MQQLFTPEKAVSLKEFCTYGIGGEAKELIIVHTKEEMQEALRGASARKERVFILGKGSNTLFDDRGFKGLVIVNKIQGIEEREGVVKVGAGYSFSLLGSQTARNGLGGLEFAVGIPGSVGGAVYMNAGANGSEVQDTLQEVEFAKEDGEIILFKREELLFSYRSSPFQQMKGAILSATFKLSPSPQAKTEQKKMLDYRMKTQPYKEKSCGSVFRNLENAPAGRLIDQAGLKGFRIGGAVISTLHGNFIINDQGATAQNILDMIAYIQMKVWVRTGKMLEPELCYIPYEESDVR